MSRLRRSGAGSSPLAKSATCRGRGPRGRGPDGACRTTHSRRAPSPAGLDRRQLGRVGPQLDRPRHESLRRVADHLAEARRAQHAGADPGGERAARQGEDGHVHPEGIGRRGVGAVGQAVEEQVGERIARQMLWVGHFLRENNPFRRDPRRLGGLAEPGVGVLRTGQHPQHAAGHGAQHIHPALEGPGVIFCMPFSGSRRRRPQAGPRQRGSGWPARQPVFGRSADSRPAAPPSPNSRSRCPPG